MTQLFKKCVQIKAIFCLLCVFSVSLNAYTDLGKWGTQYQISEKINFQDFNTTKLTKKIITKAIKKAENSKETLPSCKQNKTRYFDPSVILDHDINIPKYHINIPKGTIFNPLKYGVENKYILLVDGSDENQTALAEHLEDKAEIIVFNGNIDAIQGSIYSHIYIADKAFVKTFAPRCLPSIYVQEKNKFLVKEINMKSLLSGDDDD